MNIWISIVLSLMIFISGCAEKDRSAVSNENYEVFAKKVFDAIAQKDENVFIELCANANDLKLNGSFLLYPSDRQEGGRRWIENLRLSFNNFLKQIDRTGEIESLKWVQFGKAIGSMPSESGFIGNMYILVKINDMDYAIEIGCTQLSKKRGRLITDSGPLMLRTMNYYKINTDEPELFVDG